MFGALAFGQMTRERTWPADLIQRLRLASQVFANALQRKRAEQKLRHALAEIKQLRDRLHQENAYLRQEAQCCTSMNRSWGEARRSRNVLSQVEQVARTEATVLLLGETGTGKELMATAIHNLSVRRRSAPW